MNQIEFDFGVAATSDYDADGHLQIQRDSPGAGGGTTPAEAITPLGFYARPLDPEKDGASTIGIGAALLGIIAGDDRYELPLNDPRDADLVPKLKKGGRMMAGGAGDFRSFISIDGLDPNGKLVAGSLQAIASYPKDGKKRSLSLYCNVRTSGKEEIGILHGEGQRITLTAKGAISLVNAAGDAWIETGAKGNVLAGKTIVQGSLTVGEPKAAKPVASAVAVVDAITTLSQAIIQVAAAASLALGAQGATPAAAAALQKLATTLAQIPMKQLSST